MAQWSGGPPWNLAYWNSYYAMNFEDVLTNPSMSQIGIWDRGYYYCNVNDYATCQTDGSGEGAYGLPDVPKGHSDAPYIVNTTTGDDHGPLADQRGNGAVRGKVRGSHGCIRGHEPLHLHLEHPVRPGRIARIIASGAGDSRWKPR